MEASHKTHRPHIKVGKDEEEEDAAYHYYYICIIVVLYLLSVNSSNELMFTIICIRRKI